MLDSIKRAFKNNIFDSKLIYLIFKITDDAGIFAYDNKVIYMVKNVQNIPYKSLDTINLSLRCNLKISSVEDYASFSEGYYNIIMFNSDVNSEEFSVFVSLCDIYSKNTPTIKFDEFFFQLTRLFQMPREESYTNLIGFFGEIWFIYETFNKYEISIADFWHVNGSNDIYDFSFLGKFNCEIKTTVKDDNTFKIKHKQLFNNDDNYVLVYNIQENPTGFSIKNIIDLLNKSKIFSDNINFQIKLEEEKKKCNIKHLETSAFSVVKSYLYFNKELETLNNIPSCINNINYNYTFDCDNSFEMSQIIDNIKLII